MNETNSGFEKKNWVHSVYGINLYFYKNLTFIQIFICIVYLNISMYKEGKMGSVCRLSSNNDLGKRTLKKGNFISSNLRLCC